MRSIAFLLLLFMWPGGLKAQMPELVNDPAFRKDAKAAIDSIYNFNVPEAGKMMAGWQEQYPDHPLWMLFDGIELWWRVLSDLEDTSHDKEFFAIMEQTDYRASKLLQKDNSHVDGLIIKAISNGYIARQYANREKWLTSVNTARRALSAYDYLKEIQPDLADLKLAEGLKRYYAAYLPEAYPIIKTISWVMPEGNRQQGLEYMRQAAEDAVFARAEAVYFLGNINYNYEKEYHTAASYFKHLYERYPRNNYYARIYVKSLYKMKKYDQALQVIDESIQRWNDNRIPHEEVLREELLTWKGRILSKNGKPDRAIEAYRDAFEAGERLPRTEHRSFHVVSGYYLGKLLSEKGEYGSATYYLERVRDCEAESAYRKLAGKLLENIPEGERK